MDKVEVKVSWRLVWSIWWRMMLISVVAWGVFYLLLFAFFGFVFFTVS